MPPWIIGCSMPNISVIAVFMCFSGNSLVLLSHILVQWLHPSRRGQEAAPQDEVPHGEERGTAARLEPCCHGYAVIKLQHIYHFSPNGRISCSKVQASRGCR